MSQISEIKNAKGKSANKLIYIDGNFVCSLSEFAVFKHKLKEGQQISLSELEKISCESDADAAFQKSVALLSKTPKTKKQMYELWQNKGYLPAMCDMVMQKLEEYHFIDDERYATSFVNTYRSKFGKNKLQFMLTQKGVDKNIIDSALNNLDEQQDLVITLAKKYMKGKEGTAQNYAKLGRFLAGKGFVWDEINNAISEIKNNENWD